MQYIPRRACGGIALRIFQCITGKYDQRWQVLPQRSVGAQPTIRDTFFIISPTDGAVFISCQYFCGWGKFRMVFVTRAQHTCQTVTIVKRNVRAGAPQAHVPNGMHAHCIQNLYKPVRAFTTETNCKNLWHISTKIVRLTSNSNDFPASRTFAPTLYDNSIKSSLIHVMSEIIIFDFFMCFLWGNKNPHQERRGK